MTHWALRSLLFQHQTCLPVEVPCVWFFFSLFPSRIRSMPMHPGQPYVIKPKYYHTHTTHTQTHIKPQFERPIPLSVAHNPIHGESLLWLAFFSKEIINKCFCLTLFGGGVIIILLKNPFINTVPKLVAGDTLPWVGGVYVMVKHFIQGSYNVLTNWQSRCMYCIRQRSWQTKCCSWAPVPWEFESQWTLLMWYYTMTENRQRHWNNLQSRYSKSGRHEFQHRALDQ